jgi:nitrite reductase/ring-hydroxylating ferredoxin subunit/uncharacterized membrane protein
MRRTRLVAAIDRLENAEGLDPLVNTVRDVVDRYLQPPALRDLLHGVPLGHPLHPLLVQVPLGAWLSAAALDVLPGTEQAARMLVGLGVLGAVPAALAGYNDWSKLHEQHMRVGLLHAAANQLATVLHAASFVQRTRGRHGHGKVLGACGLAVAAAGGFLGGHLSYRQAAGANHTEDVPYRFPAGWQQLTALNDLADGRLERHVVGEMPLLVFREGDDVNVLSDVCSHLSAPLDEGRVLGLDEQPGGVGPCVECPWHKSVFSLRTGDVVHGPATSPQPKFTTRITNGMVEVKLRDAG